MATPDRALFDGAETEARLAARFSAMDTARFLRLVSEDLFPGQIALVSSFGADSAVLLDMIAAIDKSLPILFIDTELLFAETLAYRDTLIERLDLRNVIVVKPDPSHRAKEDSENFLWASDPDHCCHIRKVLPLAAALEGYGAWITGRKRYQARTRTGLALFEADGERVKVNPLAFWSAADIETYLDAHRLPRHPLVAKGFPSIGCIPCTSPVKPGEDPRAGRWRDKGKIECGLHTQALTAEPFHSP
jgi:phosphoadenosine phosphosulfate reductase